MTPEQIESWVQGFIYASNMLNSIPLANFLGLIFLLCFIFPKFRKRVFGNGNGVTKEELDKHVAEDGKRVEDMRKEMHDGFVRVNERLDRFIEHRE